MPQDTDQTLIAGRYRLGAQLGKGGMGVVWRAEDTLLKREVAVKEIRFPVALQEEESKKVGERVLREARAAAQLNHSGAVAVYDVLQGDDKAFIVMECVDAPNLDDIIKASGPLDERRAAAIALEVLDTLEEAHGQGIVHRDVKPANVMVPDVGPVKLADFGIASVRDDPRLTASGMILGSPAYMAPEQAQEKAGTPATDLWSLGATLYTAVEGRAPFDKGNAIATLGAVLNEEPEFERAHQLRPIIMGLLAKEQADRPSLAAARAQLRAVVDGDPSTTAAATAFAATPTKPVTEIRRPRTEVAVEPAPRSQVAPPSQDRSNRWLVSLGVAVLLGVLAWFTISALTDEEEPGRQRAGGNAQRNADDDSAPQDDAAGEVADDPDEGSDEVVAPDNWSTHVDDVTGYEIAYPEGWEIVPVDGSDTRTDFRDPATGTYMRVEWTDAPGDDVVGRLEEIAADFASQKASYQELRIESVDFLDGWEAGEWEYIYEEGSILHAVNLQFVNGEYGFALNFQTRDQNWDVSQEIFNDFKASFIPPG